MTNTLGKPFFEQAGIEVGADGRIAGGFQTPNPTTRALFELRKLQTLADQKRGTLDAMRYAASLGVTTHLDQGGFPAAGTAADARRAFRPLPRLRRAARAVRGRQAARNRMRVNFLHMETDPATPELAARLKNVFPISATTCFEVVGIGEFTAGASPILAAASEPWSNGTRRVAASRLAQREPLAHAGRLQGHHRRVGALTASLPAAAASRKLRWVVAHVPFITQEYIDKLKALGGGVSVLGGWRYISGTAQQNGPPFRMLLDSGIPMGMSSDGMQISPMNPWLGLYYVVTGKNARGELINAGQTLSRAEGMRLYTAANGWFLNEEDMLGTIEPGKYADLAVL